MPVTTTRRSPSPIDLAYTGLDEHKPEPSLSLYPHHHHRISTSASSISSTSSPTSSIVNDAPHHTPPPKLPFNNASAWTLYDFEAHARCCPTCQNNYHSHITTSQICHAGHNLAQKVVDLVYHNASSRISADNGIIRLSIPAGHVYVKKLLLAVESTLRRHWLLAESRAYRQRYSSFDRTFDVQARGISTSAARPIVQAEIDHDADGEDYSYSYSYDDECRLEPQPHIAAPPVQTLQRRTCSFLITEPAPARASPASAFAPVVHPTSSSAQPIVTTPLHEHRHEHKHTPSNPTQPPTTPTTTHTSPPTTKPKPPSTSPHDAASHSATNKPGKTLQQIQSHRNTSRNSSRSRSKTQIQPSRKMRWSWFLT